MSLNDKIKIDTFKFGGMLMGHNSQWEEDDSLSKTSQCHNG